MLLAENPSAGASDFFKRASGISVGCVRCHGLCLLHAVEMKNRNEEAGLISRIFRCWEDWGDDRIRKQQKNYSQSRAD